MLNILPIPASDIILYLNIAFGVILFLTALLGFLRGTKKSLVHLIVWVVLFLAGLFTYNLVIKALLNLDISRFNINIDGKKLITLNSFIQEFLVDQFPTIFTEEMLVNGTNANAFISGIVLFAGKIVYWILWLIICFIFSRIIDAIVWGIVKPKKSIINGKKKAPKKSLGSRMGGFGIGLFRGLLATLLLFFIVAGISSIATSVSEISEQNVNVGVVCTEDDLVFLDLSTENSESDINQYLEEYQDLIDVFVGYRNSIPGKIFGAIKLDKDNTTLDEKLFDAFFQIEGKDNSIELRKEIKKLSLVMQNDAVKQMLTEGFKMEDLAKLNSESLKEAIDILTSLDVVKVLAPIGVEVITYTSILANVLGDQYQEIHELLMENVNKFNEIDYGSEIQKVGYAVVDIVELLGDGLADVTTIDYLNLDTEKVESIFKSLSEMQLLDLVAPVAVSYLISSDFLNEALANAGFTVEDLNLESIMNKEDFFSHEFLLIPELYKAIVELNIKIDGDTIDFSNVKEEKVDALVNKLFSFYIVDNAIPVVASTLYLNFMPDEYKSLITEEELKATNWKEELSPIMTAAVVILKTDILTSEDPLTTISQMSDKDFEDLGKYLSQSSLLCNHMNDLIDILVSNLNVEGLEIKGLDASENEYWDETEIVSLFKAAKVIINTGIISSDDPMESLKQLDDESIDNLASSLSSSKFFTKNLNVIVDYLINQINIEGLKLETLDESKGEKWDEKELKNLLHAFKTVLDSNLISSDDPLQAFKDLTNDQVDSLSLNLSNSKFFTKNLNNVINYLISQVDLGDITFESLDSSKGENWDYDEIHAVLSSLKDIIDTGILTSEDPMQALSTITNEQIESLSHNLSSSKFFTKNLGNVIDSLLKQVDLGDITFESLDSSKGENWDYDEIHAVLSSLKDIIDTGILTSEDPMQALSTITNEQIESLSHNLSSSKFFTKNLGNVIDSLLKQVDLGDITFESLDSSKGENWDYDEIHAVLNSLNILVSLNIVGSEDPMNEIKNISDENIEILATSISNSIFMTKNLSPILEVFTKDLDFNIATLTQEEWTSNEIYSVFKSFKTISSAMSSETLNVVDLLNLSERDLDILLESKLFRESLKNILVEKSQTGQELELLKGIYDDDSHYSWNDIRIEGTVVKRDNSLIITKVNDVEKYIIYKNGIYFASSKDLNFDLTLISDYTYNENDVFTVSAITTSGELRNVFNAISCLEISDINNIAIDLRNVVNNKETLFKSYILVETLVDQIRQQNSVLIIPVEYQEGGTGIWKDENGNVGELSKIITALDVALGISTTTEPVLINDISTDKISLKKIVENKETIFASDVISATIINTIQELNKDNTIVVPLEYLGSDYSLWKDTETTKGELSLVLDALNKTILLPETGFELDLESIKINNIIDNKDEILKSAILTATIVDKIIALADGENAIINIPNDYKVSSNHSWNSDYTLWKNEYSVDYSSVKTYGELNNILVSLSYALIDTNVSINAIDLNNISLKNIIDNREEVFKSVILSYAIIDSIRDINETGELVVPKEYLDSYDIWLGDGNELYLILDAIDAIDLIPQTGLEIDINDLTLEKIINNKEAILASAVLSATFIDKVVKLNSVLNIPDKFIVSDTHIWNSDYQSWKDTNELSKLIDGLSYVIINKAIPVESIDVNNISLKQVIENKDVVFSSEILAATLVDKIQELANDGTIIIPEEYKGSYETWLGTNKELSLFLDALSYVVDIPETGFNISTTNIDLKRVINNQNQILKSAVLTATITDKIEGLSTTLIIPSEKKVASTRLWASDYDFWKNEYNSDYSSVIKYGELSNILNSIDAILNISTSSDNVSIDSLTTELDNIYIEDIVQERETILKSYIISATIIDKIVSLDGNGLVVPTNYKITASTDYDKWMSIYESNGNLKQAGELDRFLVSVYSALGLTAESKTSLNNFDISSSIDTMITSIVNDSSKEYRNSLLGSIVVSETIVSQITSFKSLNNDSVDYISQTESTQASLNNNIVLTNSNNRSDWYVVNNGIAEEKELWNVLTSVSILLGKSGTKFSEVNEFDINTLLSADLKINYNESYEVTESDIEVMLKSYIIEEVFANISRNLMTSSTLSSFFDSTLISNFNYYKESQKVKNGDEYDLRTFLESFYIMNKHIDYSDLSSNYGKLIELGKDQNSDNLNDLGAGMVISRVFKGSIANIYNGLFLMYYGAMASQNPSLLATNPYDSFTKFEQTNYNGSKVEAHDNFVSDYKVISNEYSLIA